MATEHELHQLIAAAVGAWRYCAPITRRVIEAAEDDGIEITEDDLSYILEQAYLQLIVKEDHNG